MKAFGAFLGFVIVFLYLGTLLNFVLKRINGYYRKKNLKKKIDTRLMRVFVKNHRYWGYSTILFILLHFWVQSTHLWLSQSGMIAGITMIAQVLLGMYGTTQSKKRSGVWFILHRLIAVLLIIALAMHIL